MNAAKYYDPAISKFSVYAGIWIKYTIAKRLNDYRLTIHVPYHIFVSIKNVNKVLAATENDTGSFLTGSEKIDIIAALIYQNSQTAKEKRERGWFDTCFYDLKHARCYAANLVFPLLDANNQISISLSDPHDSAPGAFTPFANAAEEEPTIGDTIVDPDAISPEDATFAGQLATKVANVLDSELSPQQARIVKMRFGLQPYERVHSLEEIGAKESLTNKAIREIEFRAFRRLRHPLRSVSLKGSTVKQTPQSIHQEMEFVSFYETREGPQ